MKNGFIKAIYDKKSILSTTDEAVAEVLIKNFDNLNTLSIQKIATMANCSKPMVTNFCKKIGLSGFKQLKKAFPKTNENSKDITLSKTDIIRSIETTNQYLVTEDILGLAKELTTANKVNIISSGFMKWIGYLFAERLNKLGINAEYIYDKYDFDSANKERIVNIVISNTGMNKGIFEFIKIMEARKITNKNNTVTISLNKNFEWKQNYPKSIIGVSYNEDLAIFRKALPINSINVILHIINMISIELYYLTQELQVSEIKR